MLEGTWLRHWCEQVWAEHKYLIMLGSYRDYRQIATLFQEQLRTGGGQQQWEAFANQLLQELTALRTVEVDAGNAQNALSHAFGHLKKQVTIEESIRWHAMLDEDWRRAWEELFSLAMSHGDPYLKRSRLFSPQAPAGHVWLRWKKQDWLVQKHIGQLERVLSTEEVRNQLPDLTEDQKVEYRLTARLGSMTSPLEIYEKME